MNILFIKVLKTVRRIYLHFKPNSSMFGFNKGTVPLKEYANDLIYNLLITEEPVMIGRFGSTELQCLINYLGVKYPEKYKSPYEFIKGKTPPWWWESIKIDQMYHFSGFFPKNTNLIEEFCELMISDMKELDVLGSWMKEESFFTKELIYTKKVVLEDIEPFFCNNPWTKALENKKVLVVHPFSETIQNQYKNKNKIFSNNFLPHFDLITIKAVQSLAGEKTEFKDWFEALEHLKSEIDKVDYDICLIGAGAYGFPLAAHVKRMGKKAVHLGGVTQLLFGIKGKRWDDYTVYPYTNLYNEYWCRAGLKETPKKASSVEGGCYW